VFKKRFKLGWYELGNGKKCELQHHLYVLIEKSLDLDLQNELSTPILVHLIMLSLLRTIHVFSSNEFKVKFRGVKFEIYLG